MKLPISTEVWIVVGTGRAGRSVHRHTVFLLRLVQVFLTLEPDRTLLTFLRIHSTRSAGRMPSQNMARHAISPYGPTSG